MQDENPNMEVFIHPSSIVDAGASLGSGTKVWHFCHIMAGASLGRDCVLGQNVFIAEGVRLGNGVKVQNNVSIYKGVTCADDVFLGPSMVFTNVLNPRAFVSRKTEFRPTFVDCGASIGANVTVVCGIRIGRYALIGAGAVLTQDVPDFALAYGVPAKIIGFVSKMGHRLDFDAQGMAFCPESGEAYQLEAGVVAEV